MFRHGPQGKGQTRPTVPTLSASGQGIRARIGPARTSAGIHTRSLQASSVLNILEPVTHTDRYVSSYVARRSPCLVASLLSDPPQPRSSI